VPILDTSEDLLRIVYSMLEFSKQEISELTRHRQGLRQTATVGNNMTPPQIDSSHSRSGEFVTDKLKKGIKGFF
jgi:hypothetical protein